jgi:hypothetical protein
VNKAAVIVESGTTVSRKETGEFLRTSGHHPFLDYFIGGDATALAPLCAALS